MWHLSSNLVLELELLGLSWKIWLDLTLVLNAVPWAVHTNTQRVLIQCVHCRNRTHRTRLSNSDMWWHVGPAIQKTNTLERLLLVSFLWCHVYLQLSRVMVMNEFPCATWNLSLRPAKAGAGFAAFGRSWVSLCWHSTSGNQLIGLWYFRSCTLLGPGMSRLCWDNRWHFMLHVQQKTQCWPCHRKGRTLLPEPLWC